MRLIDSRGVMKATSVQGGAAVPGGTRKQQSDADHRLARPVVTGAKGSSQEGKLLVLRGGLNVNHQSLAGIPGNMEEIGSGFPLSKKKRVKEDLLSLR